MTDEIERLETAKRGVIKSITELFWAWRETDQVSGPEKFFDSIFDPCVNAACKEIGI